MFGRLVQVCDRSVHVCDRQVEVCDWLVQACGRLVWMTGGVKCGLIQACDKRVTGWYKSGTGSYKCDRSTKVWAGWYRCVTS